MPVVLQLYGHSYCHLCEEMQKALIPWREQYGFEVHVIDITEDVLLEHQFGEKVPVLVHDGVEICHYFLDESALKRRLIAT